MNRIIKILMFSLLLNFANAQLPQKRFILVTSTYQTFDVLQSTAIFIGEGINQDVLRGFYSGTARNNPQIAKVYLGDTLKWKFDGTIENNPQGDLHTISSDTIPVGAAPFDYNWDQAGADTNFMYIPTKPGLYKYKCKPHTDGIGFEFGTMYGIITVVGTSLTGINDAEIEYTATHLLYPNPAKNTVNVPLSKTIKYTLEVTNTNGDLVKSLKVENTDLYELDVSQLESGFYYLHTKYCGCSKPKKGCTGASRSFKFVKE